MPYAPTYKPGQVDSPRVSGERLRAADDNGGWLGGVAAGLSTLGKGVADYAAAEDKINELADDTNARAKALAYQQGASQLLAQYGQLKGQNAVDAKGEFEENLAKLRDETLGSAANQREGRFLNERVTTVASAAASKLTDHSLTQLTEYRDTVFKDGIRSSSENAAISYADIDARAEFMAEAKGQAEEYAKFLGVPASVVWRDVSSGIHANTVAAMVTSEDFVMGKAYLDAHGDEMTAKDRLGAMNALKGPLDDIDAEEGFLDVATGGIQVGAGNDNPSDAAPRRRPVGGNVSNTFGDHQKRGSAGLDIAGNAGAAIHPAADGVVIEAGRGSTGGNFIRVRHATGEVTSYMHMAAPTKLKAGDTVNGATVLGTVGATGRASGPHLHFEVKDGNGRQIDPEAWLGGTSPVGSAATARDWDEGAVYANIDKKVASGEWSLAKADRVRARAQKRFGIDNAAIADRREAAAEAASSWLIENQDFTDLNQMPSSIRNGLAPSTLVSYQNMATANKSGGNVTPNGMTAIQLTNLAIDNPTAFAKLPLGELAGQMTRAEFESFTAKQSTIKTNRGKWSPTAGLKEALSRNSQFYRGAKLNDADRAAIGTLMEDYLVNRFANGKEIPTKADEDAAFRWATQTIATTIPNPVFGDKASSNERFRVQGEVTASTDRRDARGRFQDAVGRLPMPGETLNSIKAGLTKAFIAENRKAPTAAELAEELRNYGLNTR